VGPEGKVGNGTDCTKSNGCKEIDCNADAPHVSKIGCSNGGMFQCTVQAEKCEKSKEAEATSYRQIQAVTAVGTVGVNISHG